MRQVRPADPQVTMRLIEDSDMQDAPSSYQPPAGLVNGNQSPEQLSQPNDEPVHSESPSLLG